MQVRTSYFFNAPTSKINNVSKTSTNVTQPAATVTPGAINGTVNVLVIIALETTKDCIANAVAASTCNNFTTPFAFMLSPLLQVRYISIISFLGELLFEASLLPISGLVAFDLLFYDLFK